MDSDLKFFAERQLHNNRIAIYAGIGRSSNHVVNPLTITEIEDGTCSQPMMTIDNTSAQQLMDELWNCGLRPSEGTGSVGSLRATENHLKDMRKIVFNKLKIGDK